MNLAKDFVSTSYSIITKFNKANALFHSINIGYNKKSYIIFPKYNFSTNQHSQSIFHKQNEQELFNLEQQYRQKLNLDIFKHSIQTSTGLLDQMTIFKIYKVIQTSTYNKKSYQRLFEMLNTTIKKKSDNMLLLLASIKKKIAENDKKQKQYQNAVKNYEEAMNLLEHSMVPPLFPYYSIYREYGLLKDVLGKVQQAKQALTQTVQILQDFVSHSDDNVSTNQYCKKQAMSYNCLARIDPENRNKWIDKANDSWKGYTQNRYNEIEYVRTVCENMKKLLKEDKQKGDAYYNFNLYKFENKELKDILKKVKQQFSV